MEDNTNNTARQYHRNLISELITAFVCAYLIYAVCTTLGYGLDLRFLIPGIILILVLLQNCFYWFYRYRSLSEKSFNTQQALVIFSVMKKIMPFVFAVYPIYLMILAFTAPQTLTALITLLGAIITLLALIEYLNLYHFDLRVSIQTGQKQPSALARILSQ